jgi:hypothetical protein
MDIYGVNGTVAITPESFGRMKKIMFNWINGLMNSSKFKRLINIKVTMQMKYILLYCTEELLDKVYHLLGRKINTKYLQAIGCACFLISAKLMFGYDYMQDSELEELLIDSSAGGCDPKRLHLMEADILRKTDWKGCDVLGIQNIYDPDENPNPFVHLSADLFQKGAKKKVKK